MGHWSRCLRRGGPGVRALGLSSTSGLSDLFLEFGLFLWGPSSVARANPRSTAGLWKRSLPVPSWPRFVTGKGRTSGPRGQDAEQGWRTPGLRLPPSLRGGPLSTLASSAVKNASLRTQGAHLRPGTPGGIRGWSRGPLCHAHTTVPDSQRKAGAPQGPPLSSGKVSCRRGLASAHCPDAT